jgi:hypothetical protein
MEIKFVYMGHEISLKEMRLKWQEMEVSVAQAPIEQER